MTETLGTTQADLAAYLERWTPGGSQTASKAPGRAGPRADGFPMVAKRAHGAWLYDEGDRRYLDFVCSLAAVGLGHVYPDVTRAVMRQLGEGSVLSLPTLLEGRVAERLCGLTGWAEQARFVKTGSEATEAAVRIARAATGRDKILTVRQGYHAWHSWFQAVKPEHPGVPDELSGLIDGMAYGCDFDGPSFRHDWSEYACVILEPAPITGGGDAHWLQRLADEARQHGCLVVFDEVVWGFRLSLTGGTGFFGVTPDLACYGKALGNGIPIAAVVGRRDLMQHARLVSGTYGGETLGLAAAHAVMDAYQHKPVVESLWERGEQLVDGFNGLAPDVVQMTGYAVHPVVRWFPGAATKLDGLSSLPNEADLMSLFLRELATRGVLFHPAGLNVMHAHKRQHVDQALEACARALEVVLVAAREGRLREALGGEPYQAAFTRQAVTS